MGTAALIWQGMKALGAKVWLGVAIVAAGALALLMAKRAGRAEAEADGVREQLENVGVRHEVEADLDRADPVERQRLRNKWTRP